MTELKLNELKMTKKEYADDLKRMFDKGYNAGLEDGRIDMLREIESAKEGIIEEAVLKAKKEFFEFRIKERLDGDVEEVMRKDRELEIINEANELRAEMKQKYPED